MITLNIQVAIKSYGKEFMKAMILAAGKGERMRPLTENTPKPLLMVQGKPLIVHHLLALARAGVNEVVINTWYLGAQIQDFLGDGAQFGLRIHYSPEQELLDTGGGIMRCLDKLGPNPFIVLSADIFTNFAFATLPKQPQDLAHLVMVDNPAYLAQGDFYLDKGRIKMTGDNVKYTYANIAILRSEFFINAPTGPFPLRDLFFKHILAGRVTGQYFNDVWYNVGTPAELAMVNQV